MNTKFWFAIHNLFGHPLMEITSWFGLNKFSNWIHDVTLPRDYTK